MHHFLAQLLFTYFAIAVPEMKHFHFIAILVSITFDIDNILLKICVFRRMHCANTHTRPHRYLQTAYPTYVPSPYSVPKALYIAKAKYYLLTYLHYSYITACYVNKQEVQLMLTTGSTRLAVSRGQQTWYHSTCYI